MGVVKSRRAGTQVSVQGQCQVAKDEVEAADMLLIHNCEYLQMLQLLPAQSWVGT